MPYNGWTNYETWCVALWIGNEPGTYEESHAMTRQCAKLARIMPEVRKGIWTAEEGARFALADRLKAWVSSDLIPELPASLASDLLSAALSEVNWDEIATNYLSDVDAA